MLRATLLKLALPLLVSAFVLFVAKLRHLDWDTDLGIHRPRLRDLLVWVAVWAAWVAVSEVAIDAFGLDQAKAWPAYPPLIVLLRILAIGIAGPVSEELVMRGMLFARLSRTALRPAGAIVACAAGWALMHVQYEWRTMVLIFLDGLLLGAARHRSRSVTVPIVMHVLGNLFSIGQSLHG